MVDGPPAEADDELVQRFGDLSKALANYKKKPIQPALYDGSLSLFIGAMVLLPYRIGGKGSNNDQI